MKFDSSPHPPRAFLLAVCWLWACTDPRFIDGPDASTDSGGSSLRHDSSLPAEGGEKPDATSPIPPLTHEAGLPDASVPCKDDPTTPGHDCPGVMDCLNAGPCDTHRFTCCMELSGIGNRCEEAACGSLYREDCDGPEDCGGQACCFEGLSNLCTPEPGCADSSRLCHTDADCKIGHCVKGRFYQGIFIAEDWGFCRG